MRSPGAAGYGPLRVANGNSARRLRRSEQPEIDLNNLARRGTLTGMRAKGATPEELEALYRAKFESFVRVATAICHDSESGRDAVQSAFVAAVRGRRSFRRSGTLDAWVWRIVVNEARRNVRPHELVPLESNEQQASANGGAGDPLGVRRWVAALPQRQREAVFLRYFADLDYRTIARVLDLEPGTVSATLSSAHHTLRKRLEASKR